MNIYYLLYKLNNNRTFWIVDIDDNFELFIENYNDYLSNYDKYFIVERKISSFQLENIENILYKKQFQIFIFTKNDKIIYITKLDKPNESNESNQSNKSNKSNKLNRVNKLIKLFYPRYL